MPVGLFLRLLRRDLLLAGRRPTDTLAALLFFVLAAALFPLALGPEPALLRRIGPGALWIAALLAGALPLERLFAEDREQGALEQWVLAGLPPAGIALAKALAHWLTAFAPLLLAAAPLGVAYGLPPMVLGVTELGLALGGLVLALLGAMGAALVLGARRGAALLPLLVLPLTLPALILGAGAAEAQAGGFSPWPHLGLLAAFLAAALPLCPLAAGAALREG